jgi:hypothetical protein
MKNKADIALDEIFEAWETGDFSQLDAKYQARWSEKERIEMELESQRLADRDTFY